MWCLADLPRWVSRWRASIPTWWCRVAKTLWTIREGGRRGTCSPPSRVHPLKPASAGDALTGPIHLLRNCCRSSTKQRRLWAVVGTECKAASLVGLGPLFTGVRGIGILGSSHTRSCISAPATPEITLSHTPLRPAPAELVTAVDRYACLWMLCGCKH